MIWNHYGGTLGTRLGICHVTLMAGGDFAVYLVISSAAMTGLDTDQFVVAVCEVAEGYDGFGQDNV